ncbi:hypothetical protein B0A55_06698 [Friedmanniomyces simplex]|uniref:Uncharacterized protein n=1 Tax=Friedmanniomyces simplex TaxID=329884 RepID=A0A4U0XAN0_9PEZI|nr:hypothetical protein B0A55_06698 [Friedmanniomyces simplex]
MAVLTSSVVSTTQTIKESHAMTVKATFPHGWFVEGDRPNNNNNSSSSSSSSSSINNKASNGAGPPTSQRSPSEPVSSRAPQAEHIGGDGSEDPISTPDLTRRNSFDFVMAMAKRAEEAAAAASATATAAANASASVPDEEAPARPTPTASRSFNQESNTYVQRRALPGPTAAKRTSVHAEPIELMNLPPFTRSGQVGRGAPVTPPAAHLQRR